jgi:hypothetical protein
VAEVGDSEEGVGERAAGDGSVDEWSRSMAVEGSGVVMVGQGTFFDGEGNSS